MPRIRKADYSREDEMFWWFCIAAIVGYALGYFDGRYARPPDPLKGNFQGCEDMEEQDKEYPDKWL